jgi:hypothetical protein
MHAATHCESIRGACVGGLSMSGSPVSTSEVRVWLQAVVDLWDKVLDGYADLTVVSGRGTSSLSHYTVCCNTLTVPAAWLQVVVQLARPHLQSVR